MTRFITCDVALDPDGAAYCQTLLALPVLQQSIEAAVAEPGEIDVEF